MALLDIRDLHLSMRSFDGEAHVLNGINLTVERGEIWGIVGETGCGKSLTGLSISRLVATPPGRYRAGSIHFDGQDLLKAPEEEMRRLRGRRIGMIFQDPTTNLNPVFRVSEQMIDVALHAGTVDPSILDVAPSASRVARRAAARRLAIAMLDKVGIPDAAKRIDDYPHQFSGGMRQRVLIAMALIGRPDLLIADEPTTALDVSVQAQILRLIYDLVQDYRLTVLMITHNLGVVAQLCSHVAVMYAGNIVEAGPARAVFKQPTHPYTRALLEAVPRASQKRGSLFGLAGSVPNLFAPPPGCRFAPRCPLAEPRCTAGFPDTVMVGPGHGVACVRAEAAADAAA
jgi:oligopeptide/dipeptide ABC transporter ATP-binding protein